MSHGLHPTEEKTEAQTAAVTGPDVLVSFGLADPETFIQVKVVCLFCLFTWEVLVAELGNELVSKGLLSKTLPMWASAI